MKKIGPFITLIIQTRKFSDQTGWKERREVTRLLFTVLL